MKLAKLLVFLFLVKNDILICTKKPSDLFLSKEFCNKDAEREMDTFDKLEKRNASRAFVKLENDIFFTHQKKQVQANDFESLCQQVQRYKDMYLKILQNNVLLTDADDECVEYNPFNERLLGALAAMARVYQFDESKIPLKVASQDNLISFPSECSFRSDVEPVPTPNSEYHLD